MLLRDLFNVIIDHSSSFEIRACQICGDFNAENCQKVIATVVESRHGNRFEYTQISLPRMLFLLDSVV